MVETGRGEVEQRQEAEREQRETGTAQQEDHNDREHLERAVERGRGVVLTSTHVGNWELAAVVLAHWGYTLHAVAGVQLNRWLTSAVRETKSELAIHTVSPEDGFRKLLRALEHNDLVALMVDGDIYRHGTRVEMFGRETSFPAGPAALARPRRATRSRPNQTRSGAVRRCDGAPLVDRSCPSRKADACEHVILGVRRRHQR